MASSTRNWVLQPGDFRQAEADLASLAYRMEIEQDKNAKSRVTPAWRKSPGWEELEETKAALAQVLQEAAKMAVQNTANLAGRTRLSEREAAFDQLEVQHQEALAQVQLLDDLVPVEEGPRPELVGVAGAGASATPVV